MLTDIRVRLTVDITVVRDVHGVTLQIADHGHGMPSGKVELIRNGKAIVGVGIAGMRERVRQLGGRFEIESDDKGTRIRAALPLGNVGSDGERENNGGKNDTVRPDQISK